LTTVVARCAEFTGDTAALAAAYRAHTVVLVPDDIDVARTATAGPRAQRPATS